MTALASILVHSANGEAAKVAARVTAGRVSVVAATVCIDHNANKRNQKQ